MDGSWHQLESTAARLHAQRCIGTRTGPPSAVLSPVTVCLSPVSDPRAGERKQGGQGRDGGRPGAGGGGPGSSGHRSSHGGGSGSRSKPGASKFAELLGPQGPQLAAGGKAVNSAAAYLADLRAMRDAERKLGMKRVSSLACMPPFPCML